MYKTKQTIHPDFALGIHSKKKTNHWKIPLTKLFDNSTEKLKSVPSVIRNNKFPN